MHMYSFMIRTRKNISLTAFRNTHSIGALMAQTEEEAVDMAINLALSRWPRENDYTDHEQFVEPIPDDFVLRVAASLAQDDKKE